MEKLSIKDCISFAWKTFRARPWLFVYTGLIIFGVNIAIELVQTVFDAAGETGIWPITALLSFVLSIVTSTLIGMGTLNFGLKAHDTNAAGASYKDLWAPKHFWKYLVLSVIVFVAVLLGLVLLVVPGIIVGLLFTFGTVLVVDRGLGPIEALKESIRLTRGNLWKLFLLALALLGLNILGVLALIIGLLVTVPVSMLASIHAYRTLAAQKDALVPNTKPEEAPAA